jgi:sulfonate transport system permease protein
MTDASLPQFSRVLAAPERIIVHEAIRPGDELRVVTVVADVPLPGRSRRRASLNAAAWRSMFLPWLLPFGLIGLWQLCSVNGIISTAIVPAPSEIWNAARQLAERGELQHDILVSLRRVLIGFGLGATCLNWPMTSSTARFRWCEPFRISRLYRS